MGDPPRVRAIHQIFKIGNDPTIYIGRGIEKICIENPEEGFETFICSLDGKSSVEALQQKFPKYHKWIKDLHDLGIIEYEDVTEKLSSKNQSSINIHGRSFILRFMDIL